jgi:hypothetical protein
MRKPACLIAAAAILHVSTFAAVGAPPPASPEQLVRQERAFALDVEASGMRGGFLRFLPPDGVMLLPTPAPGRPYYADQAPSTVRLDWLPDRVALSRDGQLGFTSGPWTRARAAGVAPTLFGHYVSVWRRDADGTWWMAFDSGVEHAVAPEAVVAHMAVRPRTLALPAGRATADCATPFVERWRGGGRGDALAAAVDADSRLLQVGGVVDGSAVDGDRYRGIPVERIAITGRIESADRDLQVVYGVVAFGGGEHAGRDHGFAQIWTSADRCRLLLEIVRPPF